MSARRLTVRALIGFLLVAPLGVAAQQGSGQVLTIAAASDLQSALLEVVTAYEKKTGNKVRVIFGSSGNFFAQIQNGAPFDLFFSADVDYPQRLEVAGLTKKDSLYRYAIGKIVVWVPNDSALDCERLGLKALTTPGVKRIAIANPAHAPYGRAAKSALENAGVWEAVKDKMVMGENIAQASQFVETGNAQAGIIALALARSPRLQAAGKYWVVPQRLYPPLEQAAVVLKRAQHPRVAEEFLQFLKSPAGSEVMQRFGLVAPTPQAAKDKR